jgi:hypothetical protein
MARGSAVAAKTSPAATWPDAYAAWRFFALSVVLMPMVRHYQAARVNTISWTTERLVRAMTVYADLA